MSAAAQYDAIARGFEAACDEMDVPYKVGEKRPYSEERAALSSRVQRLVAIALSELTIATRRADLAAKKANKQPKPEKPSIPAGARSRRGGGYGGSRKPMESAKVVVQRIVEEESSGNGANGKHDEDEETS
jgi:hypothetical protein